MKITKCETFRVISLFDEFQYITNSSLNVIECQSFKPIKVYHVEFADVETLMMAIIYTCCNYQSKKRLKFDNDIHSQGKINLT